mgnify:CR=1 FL=1
MNIVIVLALAGFSRAPADHAAAVERAASGDRGPAAAGDRAPTALTAPNVSWLEPRGLNIVDLVGRVPDEHLAGAIISYTPGYGILTYASGSRIGNTVTLTATVFPRHFKTSGWSGSLFGCLGQPARIDQWGSVAPAMTARLYHGGEDVTSQVDLFSYVPAGRTQPVRNPRQSETQNRYRYWHEGEWSRLRTSFTSDGALSLPANMGCELITSFRDYERLTAVFTAEAKREISVEVLGTEALTFRSYVGAGYTGLMSNLMSQLGARYGSRHQKLQLDIPPGADYFLLNFPTQPVDAYTQFPENRYDNVDRPTGGTYRIAGAALSVDHVNSMGLPLYGHWRDSSTCDGAYLPHFQEPSRLAAPEVIVPHGIPYDPCMVSGTCPDSLLEEIWETRMTMTVVYLRVERIAGGMDQISLKMVGPTWHVSSETGTSPSLLDGVSCRTAAEPEENAVQTDPLPYRVYVPTTPWYYWRTVPPDVPGDEPQGWFAEDGRMLDFVRVVE